MTTPKTSRELLHRLLHATDTSKQLSHRDTTTRGIPATTKPPQGTERHGDGDGTERPASRREELLARQARKLLRQDDMFRKANSRNTSSSSSNSQVQPNQHRTKVVTTGAAARTSAIPRIPDRRYNRDRVLRERKRQRLDERKETPRSKQQRNELRLLVQTQSKYTFKLTVKLQGHLTDVPPELPSGAMEGSQSSRRKTLLSGQ
jgi:hypothetical protein